MKKCKDKDTVVSRHLLRLQLFSGVVFNRETVFAACRAQKHPNIELILLYMLYISGLCDARNMNCCQASLNLSGVVKQILSALNKITSLRDFRLFEVMGLELSQR